MKGSKLSQSSGLILLGFLVLSFRFPITESPTGSDNFYYITAVKSILENGEIFWAENVLSFYGLFPGTTPLGSLILGAAITEVTGLSVHNYHLIHSISLSLLSTFGFFLLSGEFTVNYKSRWFSSLAFSIAPRFLTFSIWRFSLRFSLIALLPFFLWALLRIANKKYGRNPKKSFILLMIFTLILPSLHRMGLLLPGIFLSFIISLLLWMWQENALNRERAGRQVFLLISFIACYLFYLQYLDISPYSPDDDLIGVYYLNDGTILSSIVNLTFYYLINVGPVIFLSLVGLIFWIQEGRVQFSYIFSFLFLALLLFAISDLIYIPYLFTFGILLFVAPGVDFFIDNLQDYKKRLGVFFTFLILLTISFSNLDLDYRVGAHEKEDFYYTYEIRESSISTGLWINENFYTEIVESNDQKKPRRVVAYTNSISLADLDELSSNKVIMSEMEVARYSIFDFYWFGEDHLWKWENESNQTSFDVNLSLVNLGMANFSGKSSTSSMTLDNYYKSMPDYNFKMYYSKELALYWTKNY
tara:strand:- start:4144 stop:5730 length:1587 start_codon:yes stop_codon:yes gene_type:complete